MPAESNHDTSQRIAKVIAAAGVCSRRAAEKLIEEGRVFVNGALVETPAFKVTKKDEIVVDGQALSQKKDVCLWIYHKPVGLLVTHDDPQGRPTVFQHLPEDMGRVISVGRLDLNSEGLLLLTNDGALARKLEHPKTKLPRVYRVRVFGEVNLDRLKQIEKGTKVNGVSYQPVKMNLKEVQKNRKNNWIQMTLHEGKNREIRKLMAFAGLQVSRLIRLEYGPFKLGKLKPEEISEVSLEKTVGFL